MNFNPHPRPVPLSRDGALAGVRPIGNFGLVRSPCLATRPKKPFLLFVCYDHKTQNPVSLADPNKKNVFIGTGKNFFYLGALPASFGLWVFSGRQTDFKDKNVFWVPCSLRSGSSLQPRYFLSDALQQEPRPAIAGRGGGAG